MIRRSWTVMVPLLALLLAPHGRAAARVSWDAHGLAGAGVDGNPREVLESRYRRQDVFNRLEAGWAASAPWRGARWNTQLRWGTDRYARERGETRHLLRGELGCEWRDRRGRLLQAGWIGSLREYPHAEGRGLRGHELGLQAHTPAGRRGTLVTQLRALWLRRDPASPGGGLPEGAAAWDPGRRDGQQAALELQRSVADSWRWLARGEASRVAYDRPALAAGPQGETLLLSGSQRDQSLFAGAGLIRLGVPLVRAGAGLRRTWSNSHGAGFRRLRVDLLVAQPLDSRTRILLSGRWEPAERRDEALRLFDPQADPDDPEFGARDQWTLRGIRDLGGGLSAELQAGWERSEARLPWERYERATALLAFRYETGR
ncbi:MAG: hypothetical protein FJY75_02050 [Candidatus Eisenbacteria bacterium]|uniref:TonB-dependent receptor n=1 Tax=Eiseniibacteriota bacterium TaxID=2212470 RepID=A0A937X684_UNCEI|nr:hypothetical protein [Candidatus Eisenbacteria bacterium]